VKEDDKYHFELLKQEIVNRIQQSFPGMNPVIAEWRGQEIVDFQEELAEKVNAHISEKWFYTHMKQGSKSLPRIDILNLLSKYVGYANWDDFRFKNTSIKHTPESLKKANRYFIYVPAMVLLVLAAFFLFYKLLNTREYQFRFVDADTAQPITNQIIEVQVLLDEESPRSILCEADGSFKYKTVQANIRFVAESPYYESDTFLRVLDKFNQNEIVKLRPDNYAMMLQYFSNMNVKDWKKRRDQLNVMISDSAMIYQVFDKEGIGVELFNKWEFIDKLTLPSTGLKNIEVLDTKYESDRISIIRFRQKEGEQ